MNSEQRIAENPCLEMLKPVNVFNSARPLIMKFSRTTNVVEEVQHWTLH